MKKIISLFLVLLTIMSISVTAVYAETPAVTGKCGDNITYTYDTATETLTVEGTGGMYDYLDWVNMSRYLSGKSYSKEYLVQPEPFRIAKYIKISDGITVIGKNAFSRPYEAKDVKIEEINFGKSVKTIDQGAFYDRDISHLVIPDCVITIGEEAFNSCNIETLSLGTSVKYIKKEAFSNCYNLKTIIIPDSVVSIGEYAFYGCDSAEYIELGKNVKTVGARAFILSYKPADADDDDDFVSPKTRYIVPETVTKIGKYAFGYEEEDEGGGSLMKNFVVVSTVGSAAYKYCEKYAVGFDDIDGCEKDTHIWGNKQCVQEKICNKKQGINATQCIKCGARRYEKVWNRSHDFAEEITKTVKKATYFKEGKDKTYCTTCKKYISAKTDKLSIESNVKVTAGKKKISVKYTKVKNADGFQVKYKVNGKDVTKTFNTTKSVTKSFSKLEKGYYLVKVRAFDKTDSGKLYSDWVTYSVKVK